MDGMDVRLDFLSFPGKGGKATCLVRKGSVFKILAAFQRRPKWMLLEKIFRLL